MKKIAPALALAVALALTGCTEKDAATPSSPPPKPSATTPTGDVVTNSDDEVVTEETAAPEPEDTLLPLSEVVDLEDWTVKILNVERNANSIVANENMFNDKPAGQYVLVTYEATYQGAERKADVTWDLTWSLTDTASSVHDIVYAVIPGDDWPTEARKGGTVKQQVLFDVTPGKVLGGILTVESPTIYADYEIR